MIHNKMCLQFYGNFLKYYNSVKIAEDIIDTILN